MRILVFQHLDVEQTGHFRSLWEARRHSVTTVELGAGQPMPDLSSFDLLAVMGGSMDVWQEDEHPWLVHEKATIRHWVKELGRPYLGICLGHQLLADALGGQVSLMRKPEVGLAEIQLTAAGRADSLFPGFAPTVEALQWHGAEVSQLPEGSVVLASNDACAVQAIKWGRWAYGFQFHIEATRDTVAEWRDIPECKACLKAATGIESVAELEGLVSDRIGAIQETARKIDDNLLSTILSC